MNDFEIFCEVRSQNRDNVWHTKLKVLSLKALLKLTILLSALQLIHAYNDLEISWQL